jgi:hypothetical protein
VIDGAVRFGESRDVEARHLAVLGRGEIVTAVDAERRPLPPPSRVGALRRTRRAITVRIVMNTDEEIKTRDRRLSFRSAGRGLTE